MFFFSLAIIFNNCNKWDYLAGPNVEGNGTAGGDGLILFVTRNEQLFRSNDSLANFPRENFHLTSETEAHHSPLYKYTDREVKNNLGLSAFQSYLLLCPRRILDFNSSYIYFANSFLASRIHSFPYLYEKMNHKPTLLANPILRGFAFICKNQSCLLIGLHNKRKINQSTSFHLF